MKSLSNPNPGIEWNSFFRISIALYCILNLFSFWEDIPNLLIKNTLAKSDTLDGYDSILFNLHGLIAQYGFNILFDDFVYLIIYAYLFMLGLLFLGAFTRISASFAFVFNLMIIKSMNYNIYEADYFATTALFYCIIFPRGKFSMDYYIKEFEINETLLKWSLYLLQGSLCVIYFLSGIGKSIIINWHDEESIWRVISVHNYKGLIDLSEFHFPNFIYIGLGIFILIIETFYSFFINYSKTRRLWLFFTILMHVFIIAFMGLYFFGMFMIILNVSAYYIPFLKNNNIDSNTDEESEEQLAY